MKWAEIVIHTTSAGSDIMSELLLEINAAGTVIEDNADVELNRGKCGDWDYIDQSVIDQFPDEVLVKGYISDDDQLGSYVERLKSRIDEIKRLDLEGFDIGSGQIDVKIVDDQDWANEWKKYFKPFRLGKSLVIKPSWEPYAAKKDDVILEIDPGMAFGTGTHETTQLCLMMIEDNLKKGCLVIDVGCGTGILGIAAALLGAREVLAIDRDPACITASERNIEHNCVEQAVTAVEGDLLKEKDCRADMIIINIIADVIIGFLEQASRFLNEDGVIICSGIIRDRLDDVRASARKHGFKVMDERTAGEWAAMLLKQA